MALGENNKYFAFTHLLRYIAYTGTMYAHAYIFSMGSVLIKNETNYPYKHSQKFFVQLFLENKMHISSTHN